MKTNAITRIIIWSIVLVLLIGLLGVGLYRPVRRLASEIPAATAVPVRLEEAPAVLVDDGAATPWYDQPPTCDVEATVTANGLNVRSAPSSDSPIVGMVEKGDVVSINRGVQIGSDSQLWLGIYSPMEGWITAEYVDSVEDVVFFGSDELRSWPDSSAADTSTTASASAIVTVWSAPNINSTVVAQIEAGETVTISRQENVGGEAWAYITQPSTGWILTNNLSTGTSAPAPTVSDQTVSLDPRQIREIDIEWAAGNITIEPADVDSIQISESAPADPKYAMLWKQNNDKLTIRFSENATLDFNFGISINDVISKNLTILVPMGWECDALEIDAASAAVDVKNLVIKEVDFDGASGTCNFVNCVVDELDLDTASGDIYFTGSLDTLDCDGASASVFAVFDNVPSRIDMDSMSGDLDITLPSNAGFTVTMDGLSTDFRSEFGYSQKKDGSYYRGDGKCKITMDAMSGDVYIREYKTAAAVPEATAATEVPATSDVSGTHHHTESCTTDPNSCPDNSTHHTEPHHS